MPTSETGLPEQILETAKNLFIQKGYHGLSMREISDALGVSKASLYYYFKDKEELFLAIIKIYLEDMNTELNRITAEPVSCSQKIRLFMDYVLTQPAEQRATIRLSSQEIIHLSPDARKLFDGLYREQFVGKIQVILQTGMDAGEFRRIESDVAVWSLLGIMFPYFYPTHASGGLPVPRNVIDELVKIYLTGICQA